MKARLVCISFALLLFPAGALGQGLGSIVGTLTDSSGAAVASAKVTATQTATGLAREAISNSNGYYVLSDLNPADYSLGIEAQGFRNERQALTLLADQTLTANFKLQPGATTQTVVVEAYASQVDTSTSTLGQVVERQRIAGLPLNGRNVAQLVLTVPGAVNAPNGEPTKVRRKPFPPR